jgi:hypothetical protein
MDDLRIILHRALPETPPSVRISREAAIAAGRRERTRQRWMRAIGAFLSTVVVAGGVAWGLSLRPAGTELTYGVPTPTPTPSPSFSPTPSPTPAVVASPTVRADLDLAALSAKLAAAAARIAAGFTVEQVTTSRPSSPPAAFEFVRSQGGVKAWADLRDAQGVGTVFINLNPSPYAANSELFPNACATPVADLTCETRTGPAGELIVIQQGRLAMSTTVIWSVSVSKRNGTSGYAESRNYSENDQFGKGNPSPQRPMPPLTTDQLVELLLTPGLDIT